MGRMKSQHRGRQEDDPFRRSRLRRLGVGLLALQFAVVPLVFQPEALNAFSTPKALTSWLIAALLLGVVISVAIRFGRQAWRLTPLHLAAGGLLTAYLAATVTALNMPIALVGSPDNAVGLISVVDGVVLFIAITMLVRTRAEVSLLAASLFLPVVPVVLYELVQWAGKDPFAWTGPSMGRPFSTFGNPDLLAPYLGTVAIGAGATALFGSRVSGAARLSVGAVAICGLVGALATSTRSAIVGFALVALSTLVFLTLRAISQPQLRSRSAAAALAIIALAGILALSPVGQRFIGLAGSVTRSNPAVPIDQSVLARVVLYQVALDEIRDRPVLGVGPDNFTVAFPPLRPPDAFTALGANAMETSPHDWILKVATDAGVAGLVAFGGLLVMGVLVGLGRASDARLTLPSLAALAFLLGIDLFVPNDAGTDWLLWVALGTIAAASGAEQTDRKEGDQHARAGRELRVRKHSGASDARRWLSYVPLLAAAVLALQVLPAFEAGQAAGEDRVLRLTGKLPDAVAAGERAVSLAPYKAEYWQGLGLSYADMGHYPQAETSFQRAVDLAPYYTTYLTNLARAQLALGLSGDASKLQAALSTARRAVAGDPNNGDAYVAVATVIGASGRAEAAAAAADRAFQLRFDSAGPDFYLLAGRAYLSMHRPQDAERTLRSGLTLRPDTRTWASLEVELARALDAEGRAQEALVELHNVLVAIPSQPAALELEQQIAAQK